MIEENNKTFCYYSRPLFNNLMIILNWYKNRPAFSFSATAKQIVEKIMRYGTVYKQDGDIYIRIGLYPEEMSQIIEILAVFSRPENLNDGNDYFEQQRRLIAERNCAENIEIKHIPTETEKK